MRIVFGVCLLTFCLAGRALAPANAAYRDERFHFMFTPPAPLVGIPLGQLNLKDGRPHPNEIGLFAARVPQQPFGIVVIAERMHVASEQHPSGFAKGSDFLEMVRAGMATTYGFRVVRQIQKKSDGSFTVDELDYRVDTEFDAALTFPVQTNDGDFLIVFSCKAGSQAELDRMKTAVLAARRI